MNIDAAFVDKWITLELAAALSQEPLPVEPLNPYFKDMGFYALYFPEHGHVYFGEAGDLDYAKGAHLYNLRCQRHEIGTVQEAFNSDPQGRVLFFTIRTNSRERSRELLQQFLTACAGQARLLNGRVMLD